MVTQHALLLDLRFLRATQGRDDTGASFLSQITSLKSFIRKHNQHKLVLYTETRIKWKKKKLYIDCEYFLKVKYILLFVKKDKFSFLHYVQIQ